MHRLCVTRAERGAHGAGAGLHTDAHRRPRAAPPPLPPGLGPLRAPLSLNHDGCTKPQPKPFPLKGTFFHVPKLKRKKQELSSFDAVSFLMKGELQIPVFLEGCTLPWGTSQHRCAVTAGGRWGRASPPFPRSSLQPAQEAPGPRWCSASLSTTARPARLIRPGHLESNKLWAAPPSAPSALGRQTVAEDQQRPLQGANIHIKVAASSRKPRIGHKSDTRG